MTATPTRRQTTNTKHWRTPAALIVLSAIPVAAGAFRLTQLTTGADITPENARFFDVPLPVVLHIVGAVFYSIVGAFQFHAGLRRRRPRWHRMSGRILIPAGLVTALSGLWMSQFYPLPEGDGALLYALRLVFGGAMTAALVLGFLAIRRREIDAHRAWMIRAYAIGVAAGTQALVALLWTVPFGSPEGTTRALLLGAGWVINVIVAERVIRPPSTTTTHLMRS